MVAPRSCEDSELIRGEARLSCMTRALKNARHFEEFPPPTATAHFIFPASASPVGPRHQTRSGRSGSLHGCRFALICYFGVNPSLCSLTVAPNQVKHGSLDCFIPSAGAAAQKKQQKNRTRLTSGADVRGGMEQSRGRAWAATCTSFLRV